MILDLARRPEFSNPSLQWS